MATSHDIDHFNKTHGQTVNRGRTRTYSIWMNMRSRCKYTNSDPLGIYVRAGITVCERWQKFENFLVDMGPAPVGTSIDRIDGTKGYFPQNCRWANRTEQARNRRSNHRISHLGITLTLGEWATKVAIKQGTINRRLRMGWSVEKALTAKLRGK
jgi:hypothetical protein